MKKLTIFLVILLFLPGCSFLLPLAEPGGPIITGIIMWQEGEAHKYYNEEVDVMYRSARSALKELNFPISKESEEKDGYYLYAGDKNRFKIHIRIVKPHITEVGIRINFLGDKPYADLLYTTIDNFTDTIEFENGHPVKVKSFRQKSQDF